MQAKKFQVRVIVKQIESGELASKIIVYIKLFFPSCPKFGCGQFVFACAHHCFVLLD